MASSKKIQPHAGYVHLRHPETGAETVLAPGDEVPDWAPDTLDKSLYTPVKDDEEEVAYGSGQNAVTESLFRARTEREKAVTRMSVPELRDYLAAHDVEFNDGDRRDDLVAKAQGVR